MSDDQFDDYLQETLAGLDRLNLGCEQEFRLGHWDRFDFDMESEQITFSDASGQPQVRARVQAVGSESSKTKTFRWGWANESLPKKVTQELTRVREFGEHEGLEALTCDTLDASGEIEVGWEMTAIAARVLEAGGCYRCPTANGFVYLLLFDLARVA